MVTLLARGTVADIDEQLGEERVTLLAPVGGQGDRILRCPGEHREQVVFIETT
jgi:hypothetical protein